MTKREKLQRALNESRGTQATYAKVFYGYSYSLDRYGWYFVIFGEIGVVWLGRNFNEAIEHTNS